MPNRTEPAPTALDRLPVSNSQLARAHPPEHTIATMSLMALLSAAVLYAVVWSVRDPSAAVYSWDFRSVPFKETPWRFPNRERTQDAQGVAYVAQAAGPGPNMVFGFDTKRIKKISAAVEVSRQSDGKPVPFTLEWCWGSLTNSGFGKGAWAFPPERRTGFALVDPSAPDTFTVDLTENKMWQGVVQIGVIGVDFSTDEFAPVIVRIIRIELLE